jgi:TRAP-type C4-dicarboxylate transport system permease small subunit
MAFLDRWLTRIENLLAALGIAGLLFIIAAVCAEILLRTFFARPQVWVIEFSEYALLYITFLGTSWLLRNDGHVRVDLLTDRLNGEWKRRLALASAAIGLAVALMLTVFGTAITLDQMRRGVYKPTILEFPTWLVLLVIPLGSAVLSLRFLQRWVALWRREIEPR